jgi:hypothetical protein
MMEFWYAQGMALGFRFARTRDRPQRHLSLNRRFGCVTAWWKSIGVACGRSVHSRLPRDRGRGLFLIARVFGREDLP